MVIELFPKQAPITVRNFQALVAKQFYNGLVFHRVVPGFVVQTGDPTGTGAGGSDKTIKLEVSQKLSHTGKGIVAMARKQDPNSASSQFYITLAPAPSLDGKYAVFGRVISGLDVLEDITQTDRVTELTLIPLEGVKRSPQAPPQDTFTYRLGKLVRPTKGKVSAKGGLVKP
jgi:cyclophilin family peptidyl-prolyl cis-trans isomerase